MATHPLPVPHIRLALTLLALAPLAGAALPAAAATVSWSVDADGAWNNPANWSGGAVPTLADTVVIDRPAGTRRIYRIDPTGVERLRADLDRFWGRALATFKDIVEQEPEEKQS